MLINVLNQQLDLPISPPQVRALVKEVLKEEGCKCDEITIQFVDIKTISVLHEQYFNDPSPTDCITFPIDSSDDEHYRVLGEIFICPLAAIEYGRKHDQDVYQETTLYVIHGLLHLLGHDDLDEHLEPAMRAAETAHLKHLKSKKLILTAPRKKQDSQVN